MQPSFVTPYLHLCFLGVAEDYCMGILYLAVPYCVYSLWDGIIPIITSVKIIKNEVGCRDDTVPKTVDTRRHCEEE